MAKSISGVLKAVPLIRLPYSKGDGFIYSGVMTLMYLGRFCKKQGKEKEQRFTFMLKI